jgi:hypothetical protein
MRWIERTLNSLFPLLLLILLSASNPAFREPYDHVHFLAQTQAFNFTSWTLKALWLKLGQAAIGTPRYFDQASQIKTVQEYLRLVEQIEQVENDIDHLYADPNLKDASAASLEERAQLAELSRRYQTIAPFAEASLETQVNEILKELGLTLGGQTIPWVLYHISPLPQNLVISPRNIIKQETSYLLDPNLTTAQAESLETLVDEKMGVASLVVPIGGIALYPTMVYRSTALEWLSSTVAHEWIHIYLSYQPLGWNYDTSPELRTMNETTASIAGDEIGRKLMERYYPELLHRYDTARQLASRQTGPIGPGTFPPPFNFNREMNKTRIRADELLAAGKIDEAEAYLETRRQIFWARGYNIRKLNQAFFAFYGAYADTPGGAAGADPVGPAVRELRARSATLKDFLDQIGKMNSFDDLKTYLETEPLP